MKYLIASLFLTFMVGCMGITEQTVDPNPSCTIKVEKHQTSPWLLLQPEMHFVFYGQYWSPDGEANEYEYAWSDLLNRGNVLQRLSEYGIVSGSLDVQYYMTAQDKAYPSTGDATLIPDQDIVNDLISQITAGSVPKPNDNTIYTIMLPPNTITSAMKVNKWGGYHQHSNYNGRKFAYSIIGYNTYDGINTTISHELYEAATNPDNNGGYWDNINEVADLCEDFSGDEIDGYIVSKVWSEQSCVCL